MQSLSRKAVLTLIGLTLVLHTTEEYLTIPAFSSASDGRLSGWLTPPRLLHNSHELHVALALAAVLPSLVIAWAILRPHKALLVAVLLVESVLLVNAAAHILGAVFRGGYEPGVITAY